MKNLLLIPLSFPYDIGGENTFLKSEVPFYLGSFNKVYILPCQKSMVKTTIDPYIIVDHSLIIDNEVKKKFQFLSLKTLALAGLFFTEFFENVKKTANYRGFKKLTGNFFSVCRYLRFFEFFFQNKKKEEWIIYTYWFTPITTAVALFSLKNKNIKVVTRAHGIDLYEFRNNDYIPFRKKTIGLLTNYFFISEIGRKYTEQLYPEFMSKFKIFPLGIEDKNVVSKPTDKGFLSIVSCSTIDHNKRVNLILEAIKRLALERKGLKIIWNHFGTGPLFNELKVGASTGLMNYVEYHFHGFVENESIINFYRKNRVDLFITTTASEGRPVSIMEALCCHIPVIATKVGGIPEIINDSNGILLDGNPNIDGICYALKWFADNKTEALNKKRAARNTWQQKCDANTNFSAFVKYIASI